MKKKNARKLTLHRESLRQLGDAELQDLAGAVPVTGLCAYTLQLACYSKDVPSCVCTVQ
ncbi:MAG TPA: class I lanthipeptide [Thermoanaerobaculia bacterium]|nr:class I lanthipeptide [Thermoanaerobaculia bacterium]